ncbi:MAG: hypothetical protein IT563_09495 [Alphaproteobacteria bacterium]|nr:hypothetical protein [Alphaproteobacteria bacterium]
MIRVLASIVLPLVLPTMLYLLYAWHLGRRARARDPSGGATPAEVDVPWSWLVLAGVVLMLISLAVNFVDTGAKPGAHYEPAHMENGKLVPGRTTP